jgi:hypothetical protein
MTMASVAAVALVTSASPAAAGPLADPAPWVLPVNAFAGAKAGDWTILEGDALLDGKLVHEREIIRVGSLARGVAEVQLFEGAAGKEGWFLSFPVDVKRGPDTNLLFDVPWIATDLAQEKATCTLGDASFPCVEVSYRTASHKVTVLMAARVKGSGIVSFAITRPGSATPVWSMKTIGYGTAGKVLWGAGPPRADLEGNWDGGAAAADQREGSQPAAGDVYEPEEPPPLALPPRVDVTDCLVVGDRDRGSVMRLVQRKLPALQECYEGAVARDRKKAVAGTADVRFVIDELAALTELELGGSASPAMRACAGDALKNLQFAYADGGGGSQVACTVTFDPGKPAPPRKKPAKRKLITKGHPARGGPDLRGVPRIP